MGPLTKLVDKTVPAEVTEPFSNVKILVVVVLSRPEFNVRLFETLTGVLFRVTPVPVFAITNLVNTGTGVPAIILIVCNPAPDSVAVQVFDPKVIGQAAGELIVRFPA